MSSPPVRTQRPPPPARWTRHRLRRGTPTLACLVCLTGLVGAAPAHAADATVRAVGSFFVRNNVTGEIRGLANAHIELCDDDGGGKCPVFKVGTTDATGAYDLSGRSGDWAGDLPELEVRVYADNPGVKVEGGFGYTYCFKTRTAENVRDGETVFFKSVSPAQGYKCTGGSAAPEQGAWMIYSYATEAFEFLRGAAAPSVFSGVNIKSPGTGVSRQGIQWPNDDAAAYGGLLLFKGGGFLACCGAEWSYSQITEAYTTEVMVGYLGSFPSPEDWMGSFTTYLMDVMARVSNRQSGPGRLCTSTGLCGTLEAPPHTVHSLGALEPLVAELAIFEDLVDNTPGENHDGNGSFDQTALGLDLVWAAMQTDPAPGDLQHNHPRNAVDLGLAVLSLRPTLSIEVHQTFNENHVALP